MLDNLETQTNGSKKVTEFLDKMELTLYFMRLEDKYWGVFLLALFLLFYMKKKETQGLLWMTFVLSVICICPLTAYGITMLVPSLENYYSLWHIVPSAVVVCTALTIFKENWCDTKFRSVIFALGVFAILFFSGEFAYTSADVWNDDCSFVGKEQEQVYNLILEDMEKQGKNDVSLWGPQKLMADSRVYSAQLCPIYGKDIGGGIGVYGDSLMGMYQGYTTYEGVEGPAENMEEQVMAIANCLNVFTEVTCDYVVMIKPAHKVENWEPKIEEMTDKEIAKNQELVQKVLDIDTVWIFERLGYEYVGETDSLQVFRRL